MNIFDKLFLKSINDEYFEELYYKAELVYANTFFQVDCRKLDDKEVVDLLRFSDILSRSNNVEAQNKAYKIISLLVDDYKDEVFFRTVANSVFVKLGNFPAIEYIGKYSQESDGASVELALEKSVKETFQKVHASDYVFTDAQYQIFESLKCNNHFSFSGPTSLGKSFIINAFIRYLVDEHKGTDNIIILVPTRALINQTVINLKKEFSSIENYKILAHPAVSEPFKTDKTRYIFVFTPERLVAYLSDGNNPKIDYLFVDEAQKIISEKDSRSPLYYHAILQAERKSIKLYFASPNIPNPEVFLQLFEKSTDESISVKSSPVAQNRFFIDLVEKKSMMFSDVNDESYIDLNFEIDDFNFWLKKLSANQKSIVYCNTKVDTIQYALSFAKTLPDKNDDKIDEVISIIEEHLHKRYYLIDCLKKGVAFHFGNLPQRIREKVEILFSDKAIDYMFCTSTLLEGVNLPAKNIFILNNAIGLTKFSDIDFWNLAGRSGRLAKELSGNIICTRIVDKNNRWRNPDKDLSVVRSKDIKPIKPLVINGQKNFYRNIEAALTDGVFSRKNASANEISVWNHYANIAFIHELRADDSALRSNFVSKNENAKGILQKEKKKNSVPDKILSSSSMIKAKYQNRVCNDSGLSEKVLSSEVNYDTVLNNLEMLCDFYSWEDEESSGHNPMCRSRDTLKYYAVLMTNWINATPLNRIITSTITYYSEKRVIWDVNELVTFYPSSQNHINMVINQIISDIDNVLRFKIKNYFSNYHDLLNHKLGEDNSGPNWADFLEYGTTDYRVIELQNMAIPRHLANYLLENSIDFFKFDKGVLMSFDRDGLLDSMDKSSTEFKELIEVI